MSQILVRNLDPKAVARLKARARREARSLQSFVKGMVERKTEREKMSMEEARRFSLEIQRHFRPGRSPDAVQLIREDRDR